MRRFFYLFLYLVLLFPNVGLAVVNVQFIEEELVFAGRIRSGKLTLVNKGDETSTVTLNFFQPVYNERKDMEVEDSYRMKNIDNIELTRFPYNLKLKDAIKITPRRLKLEPGERQVVRLILKKPLDLADGVYRANIGVEYIDVRHEELEKLKPETEQNVAVGIGFVTAVHIPMMIIHGKVQSKLEEFDIVQVRRKPADLISRNINSDVLLKYRISGNSLGQYIVGIYAGDDLEKPLYRKAIEVDNFVNYHVQQYPVLIEDNVSKIRVIVKQLGTEEVLFDVTKNINDLY